MILANSIRWDLLVPLLIAVAAAVGQSSLTLREVRTGDVVWWAKVKWPLKPRLDYANPMTFRARQIGNVLLSAAAIVLVAILLIKFLGF